MNDRDNNLWLELVQMFDEVKCDIKINEADTEVADKILERLQITKKSALGAIVYNTSGITIGSWIRILGSGNDIDTRNIITWNNFDCNGVATKIKGALIIADDIIGGIFALNAGKFNGEKGDVWYFAPDTLQWESLKMKYSEFISWTVNGNVDEFYISLRWNEWLKQAKTVGFNDAILVYPFLWSDGVDIEKADKKIIPLEELLNINLECSKKFGFL